MIALPHICVCICTYRRPPLLRRTLDSIRVQHVDGLFAVSVVVADNDALQSAKSTVEQFAAESGIATLYCVEPRQGIAMARNMVVQNAKGDYLAFIDDDEIACPQWLSTMYLVCDSYGVDGVLGAVKPQFDEEPPRWLLKSGLCDRRVNPTGMAVHWLEARTGNVFLKRDVLKGDTNPFRPQFKMGEDQDFFRRKIEQGRSFIWCAEAEVFEVVPSSRWKRSYWIRRGLFRGEGAAMKPGCGVIDIAKSCAAVILYTASLPVAILGGHHRFMNLVVKLCDHLGKLLALVGVHPIKAAYIPE